MEAFLISAFTVAVAEIGDRTQLLSLLLAAKFRKPVPILLGVFVATVTNHALAGIVGHYVGDLLHGPFLTWVIGLGFLACAVWTLVPDKLDDADGAPLVRGAFLTTVVAFFLAEIGDKTEVATAALAAQFTNVGAVVIGTTLGMMAANAPIIYAGHRLADRLPIRLVRVVAALIFAGLGLVVLLAGRF